MSIIDIRNPQVKYAIEAVAHAHEQAALFLEGDVECDAEEWDRAFDLWTFSPSDADLAWAARELNQDARDYDLVSLTLSEADPDEFSTPEERAEYLAWLDSLEPDLDELARRDDVASAFLGHQA